MGIVDWGLIAAYAVVMLGIGAYYSRANRSADDYLLGGRRMPSIMVGLSLFATLMSTLSYLAHPGEMIAHGPMLITQGAAHPLIFVIVGYGLIPLLMRQPVTSAYELLEKRLGLGIRRAGAGVFLLLRLGWMATILYATSKVVLVPLLNLDKSWIPWLCLGMGVLTAVYSSSGGIRAVVMTDALQSLMMISGALLTLAIVSWKMGGVSAWWPDQWPEHWQTPSWGFDPNMRLSFGVLLLSTTLWYVCTNGSDQMSIQRFLSTRDAKAARRTLAISQSTDVLVSILLALAGVAILGYYSANPLPASAGLSFANAGDQYFPKFIMTEMAGGPAGLVLAAILSAAMSSLSSGVNSSCAVLERDFLAPAGGDAAANTSITRLKVLTWLVALAAVALSILNSFIEGNIIERCFKLVNLLTAPLFVLFFLALFIRRATPLAAWLALTASVVTAIAIAYSEDLGLGIGLSFVWMTPCSLAVGIVVGTGVSWAVGARD
ncbi:MAG: sodium-coupled permease [Pirellulales bacterium]